MVLLGVAKTDTAADAGTLAAKIVNLRIFSDEAGKMNLSLIDSGGAMLVVSQFTLYGDCRKGRRPGFDAAASAEQARELYERFVAAVRQSGVSRRDRRVSSPHGRLAGERRAGDVHPRYRCANLRIDMGELSRIGVAIDSDLLRKFDRLISGRGYTNRSPKRFAI